MTTSYGTIPISSDAPSSDLEYISHAKQRIKDGLATRRPWKIMLDFHSFHVPRNLADAISEILVNISYFRMNYVLVMLFILFLSLLWHPISLIVFVILMALWVFLYFLRDHPLVILGHPISNGVVLTVMSFLTIAFLLLTHVTLNIFLSILIGVVVVLIHAAMRKTDDLVVDEEETSGLVPPIRES